MTAHRLFAHTKRDISTFQDMEQRIDTRKRSRGTRDVDEEESPQHLPGQSTESAVSMDNKLFELQFPKDLEMEFAAAIFDLGLKHASPKILMPLMPHNACLNTEHIKSHLQKYRIHKQRSKEEFQHFYERYIKELYNTWENRRCWEQAISTSIQPASSSLGTSTLQHSLSAHGDNLSSKNTGVADNLDEEEGNHVNIHDQQERLRKKMRQLVDLEDLLAQSTAVLHQWKDVSAQVYQQSGDVQRDVLAAISSIDSARYTNLQTHGAFPS